MRLERIKCKHLNHAWDITVSDSYIIACTGRRALVLDRKYQLVQSFDGLDYVYAARVSPDEKQLLLISNGNKFYVADLESGQMRRNTIRAPYNCNLEGYGCWSHDAAALLIPVMNSKTRTCALRRYDADDLTRYQDFLTKEYHLSKIHRLGDGKTYLLTGRDRHEAKLKETFLYFDGSSFTCCPLEDYLVVLDSEVDLHTGVVTLYSTDDCFRYTAEGKKMETLRHPRAKTGKVSFSDVFANMFADQPDAMAEIRNQCEALGLEHVDTKDAITKYAFSACGRFHYVASKSGFYIADARTAEILAHVPEEYGVQNFEWVEPDVIALATWGGVKLYRVIED